jgi:hypothetical protein
MTHGLDHQKPSLTYFSKSMNQEIRFHWRRTGLASWQVLKQLDPKIDDLTALTVNDWIAYRVRYVNKNYWDAVLGLWVSLPDAHDDADIVPYRTIGYPRHVAGTVRLEVNAEMYSFFTAELHRTGAETKIDFVQAEFAPEGLNERMVQILRHKTAKTIRSDYWWFMIETLSRMPDKLSLYDGSRSFV